MKHTILAAAFIALLGSAGVSWSADFQKGFAAAKSGDYATALREWKPLAEQGHAVAQTVLGFMHEKGRGVPQDDKTAVKWYQLAAEQGEARAQTRLGQNYADGQGVHKNYETSMKWLRLAAEQGYANAHASLSVAYLIGKGVIQDKIYAYMWINLAAENGYEAGAKYRDELAKKMAPAQIEKAQDLALECVSKKYKDC